MSALSVTRGHRLLPLLAVLGSVTALGLGTSLAKRTLFPAVGSLGTTSLRVGLSALLLALLWRPWRWTLRPGDGRRIIYYGVSMGFMNLLFYLSLRSIPFGLAVAIEFAGPMAVALYGSRRTVDWLWLLLAIGGLGLLLPIAPHSAALDPTGVLCALGAAVCWAAYIICGKRVGHLPANQSVALGLAVAACAVVPFGVWQAGSELLQPSLWLWGLVVAAISSAVPISLDMLALQRLPRAAFGIMASMEPAVAALLALFMLGEHLTGTQWLAIGCTMLAAGGSALTAAETAN